MQVVRHEQEAYLEGKPRDVARLQEVKAQESGISLPASLASAPTPQQTSHTSQNDITIAGQAGGVDVPTQNEVAELRALYKASEQLCRLIVTFMALILSLGVLRLYLYLHCKKVQAFCI